MPDGENRAVDPRPIRADARSRLICALVLGRRWLTELASAKGTTSETIAARERCSVRKVNRTVSLAFLAPDLVKAAIEGRLPRGVGIARLVDLPPEWSAQRKALGAHQPAIEPRLVRTRSPFPGNGVSAPETACPKATARHPTTAQRPTRPTNEPPNAQAFACTGKISAISEWVVADAVAFEPVSAF